jgi:hypothetical protein
MKQKRQLLAIAAVIAILAGGVLLHSCKKETGIIATPSYSVSKTFVGTFVGTSACGGDSTFLGIYAGTDKTKAYLKATFGAGGCQIIRTIPATIKGDSLLIPFAEYRDHCFDDYSVQGSAIYRNDSIFFSITTIAEDTTTSCYFFGRKIADTAYANLLVRLGAGSGN